MSGKKQETIADIVKRVRRDCNSYPLPTAADKMLKLVREIEAAHQRDVAELRDKLKVAEDALVKLQDRLVASVHDGTIDPHEALKIAEDAIDAIRE